MTPTIAETAHAVLAGADRNDDAKKLARWVLERLAEETTPDEAGVVNERRVRSVIYIRPVCHGEPL